MKKVAIIGSGGQLGSDLAGVLSQEASIELHLLDHTSVECTDKLSVENSLFDIRPDTVINCAAFVRVDECEEEAEKAFSVNALGAGYVAKACANIDATAVYISTDYIFDGTKSSPYTEEDAPNPLNVYGKSKLEGEKLVKDSNTKHFIIRSSGLYGGGNNFKDVKNKGDGAAKSGGRNFVETMLKLEDKGNPIRVVDDQILAPTFTKDLAAAIIELIETDRYGTYHVTNSGECSWYEFGKAVFELSGLNPDYGGISSKEYGARAVRPSYSVLDNRLVNSIGITPLRQWRDALQQYIKYKAQRKTLND